MIANDIRSLTASMKAYADGQPLPAKTLALFVERLEEIAERVERFERMPVHHSFRLTDQHEDEKVVLIRAHTRAKPRPVAVQPSNGGGAA